MYTAKLRVDKPYGIVCAVGTPTETFSPFQVRSVGVLSSTFILRLSLPLAEKGPRGTGDLAHFEIENFQSENKAGAFPILQSPWQHLGKDYTQNST